ncbi:redoxin domain-containing protein [Mycoplasmopsis lipofaciens]|uniref:redoxin domain-containing protein n=1 Tax=Mycoplasmopsis lipofaciens TaxID=114884 RepID=UPI000486EE22|nr:redoxin domain-containing protein [Mycoplasmopsis lipofaciens]
MRKVFLGENQMNFIGEEIKLNEALNLVGAKFGEFTQTKVELDKTKYTILATFPSINTGVCDLQILELGRLSEKYPQFNYVSFSMDLPSALNDYVTSHPIGKIVMYSDYYDKQVANQLGLLIKEIHLLGRAMFVLDQNNKIVYKQINSQVKNQVDFNQLEEFLKKL